MKSICVFTGSSLGKKASYKEAAIKLGKAIADEGYSMVYGGGSLGLMGVVADSVLNSGGKVIGVITEQLNKIEVGHKHLNELIVVSSMHLRKAKMAEISDAIISLPGGVGTWEEFFEALAWNQLGLYSKPIILLDIDDYYSDLYKFAEKGVQEGFLPNSTFEDLVLCNSVQSAIKVVKSFQPKDGKDWFKRLERNK